MDAEYVQEKLYKLWLQYDIKSTKGEAGLNKLTNSLTILLKEGFKIQI